MSYLQGNKKKEKERRMFGRVVACSQGLRHGSEEIPTRASRVEYHQAEDTATFPNVLFYTFSFVGASEGSAHGSPLVYLLGVRGNKMAIETEDLFTYINPRLAEKPGFCTSSRTALRNGIPSYLDWEKHHAEPALRQQGFRAIVWKDGDEDSFGPLTRYAICQREEKRLMVTRHLMYG
jgi:hypothetical protein